MVDRFILCGLTAAALLGGGWTVVPDTRDDAAYLTSGQPVQAAAAATPAAGPIVIHRDLDGLFRATVLIDDQPVAMIVDTGASRSVLALQTARRLPRLALSAEPAGRMRTLSGTQQFHTAQVEQIRVGSAAIDNHRLAVMDTPDAISVIGQDLLGQLGPITLNGRTVRIP